MTIRDRKSVDCISHDIAETGHSQVVIDLSKLDYIDAARLGIVLSLREGAVGAANASPLRVLWILCVKPWILLSSYRFSIFAEEFGWG